MSRVSLGAISWRFRHVWIRNLVTYRRIWRVNFLVPLLEPAFYILAFGLGFSGLISAVSYGGRELPYTHFMAPALVATACMATPVSLEEIIVAEIVWAASKAAAAVAVMLTVLIPMGYADFPGALVCIPLAFLGGLAFASIGMFFTGVIPTIDMFNLPIFLFITPMFLFSGTFFPVTDIPGWAGIFSLVFPLFHLVELTRYFCIGVIESNAWYNLLYLAVFTLVFGFLALWTMKRRLIN